MAYGERFIFSLREVGGACGDLGTLLPLMLACIAVAGLAPIPVVLGFAVFYVVTAVVYRLPVPVQPMKAVAAVLLTAELAPGLLAMSGVILGLVLLGLGFGGWIDRLGRLVPQSVLAGLQLGLGTALALLSLELIGTAPLIGVTTLLLVLLLLRRPAWPAALLGLSLGVAVSLGQWLGGDGRTLTTLAASDTGAAWLPSLNAAFDAAALREAFSLLVLPQLALTLTNAILLTALVAGDYFGERARHVTPRRLAVTTGLANLVLAPLGALPMCHGAGGLAAHHRFGACSGGAPLLLGLTLAAVALVPGGLMLLAMVPLAGLGALLMIAALELALSRRLIDCRPSCWPVIGITAALTLCADPFWGLGRLARRVAAPAGPSTVAHRSSFQMSAGEPIDGAWTVAPSPRGAPCTGKGVHLSNGRATATIAAVTVAADSRTRPKPPTFQ